MPLPFGLIARPPKKNRTSLGPKADGFTVRPASISVYRGEGKKSHQPGTIRHLRLERAVSSPIRRWCGIEKGRLPGNPEKRPLATICYLNLHVPSQPPVISARKHTLLKVQGFK